MKTPNDPPRAPAINMRTTEAMNSAIDDNTSKTPSEDTDVVGVSADDEAKDGPNALANDEAIPETTNNRIPAKKPMLMSMIRLRNAPFIDPS